MLVSFSALGRARLRLLAIPCDLRSITSGVDCKYRAWAQTFISWVPSSCPCFLSFFLSIFLFSLPLLSKSSRGSGLSHCLVLFVVVSWPAALGLEAWSEQGLWEPGWFGIRGIFF
ncbi:hypothetical protein LZ31DRAFT_268053 [Colletotrichum somersetense]|nr:hypothetical protein LZ31DRAFT_268053 [Colletotrichum somersetense]